MQEIKLTLMQNYDDATFDGKKHNFNRMKPKSEVNVSPSNNAQSRKQDDKTKKDAKGKKLEDIIYSDDEDDVGAKADFNNLESSITLSPILTTRIHKDHLRNPRGYIKLSKIQVRLKLCKKSFFSSRSRKFRNKARLVTQGHTQDEGIDYEEVFAPVARIKAIILFLAYASFMGFMVYQMDVKRAFLYGTIKKEVYVCQPPRFEDPDHPDKV
nr:putative ribonuclease H-like domain-containing protein [Tanacetum cinerariifolium]